MASRTALVLLIASAPSPGAAEPGAVPRIWLEVEGSCPARAEVARALLAPVAIVSDRIDAWTLRVSGRPPEVRLQLLAPDGRASLDRRIASADCRAVAGAIAVIVQTHFLQLRAASPRPEQAPDPSPEAREAAPPQPPPAFEVTDASEVSAAPAEDQAAPERPAHVVTRPAPAPSRWQIRRPYHLALSLSPGIAVAGPPARAAAQVQLDVALRLSWLLLRLAAAVESPTQQATGGERVQRWPSRLRLDVGAYFALGRWWLQAAAGGGVVLSRVSALDAASATEETRVHPVIGLVGDAGIRLATRWSIRAQVAGHVYPTADRYLIWPTGAVAQSPRVDLSATLGVQLDLEL